jgi:hypothetical protein
MREDWHTADTANRKIVLVSFFKNTARVLGRIATAFPNKNDPPGGNPTGQKVMRICYSHDFTTGSRKPGKAQAGRNQRRQGIFDASASRATARAKLISNTLDSIGMALRQRAVSIEDAMRWAHDEGIIDLLQFGPPSKAGGDTQ